MSDVKPILVADPDVTWYDRFSEDPDKGKVSFIVKESGSEVQKIIKEEKDQYSAIFVSPEMRNPDGYSIMKACLMYQPSTPIFFIPSIRTEINIDLNEAKLPVSGTFAKPFMIRDVIKKMGPALGIFDSNSALEISKRVGKGEVGKELEDTDPNFRPIKAELFISGSKSLFDVYVRLRSNKYIKILQAGDSFDLQRVLDYLKKGVVNFFIRKEALEAYVTYCDKLTKAIASNNGINLDKKFGFVFNQAEVTLNTMVDLGVDSDSIAYSQKYLKNTLYMIDEHSKKNSFISGLLKELRNFEHSGSVVMVSAVIAKAAGIETEKNLEALGLAAFLHDIGMVHEADNDDMYSDGQDKYFDEATVVEKIMSKKIFGDEKNLLEKLWDTHPDRGAKMVEGIEGLPPMVPQIIRQHHGLRDKKAGRLKGGAIHPLAEILELSDEFVRLMQKFGDADADKKKLLMNRVMDVLSDFPRRTREPFLEAFGFTKKAA